MDEYCCSPSRRKELHKKTNDIGTICLGMCLDEFLPFYLLTGEDQKGDAPPSESDVFGHYGSKYYARKVMPVDNLKGVGKDQVPLAQLKATTKFPVEHRCNTLTIWAFGNKVGGWHVVGENRSGSFVQAV